MDFRPGLEWKLAKIESNPRCSADYHLGQRLPNELVEMIAAYISHEETPECKHTGSERSNATNFDDADARLGDDDSGRENSNVPHYSSNETNVLFSNEGLYTSDWMGDKFREDEGCWRIDAASLEADVALNC